jgi:hypothetical protein
MARATATSSCLWPKRRSRNAHLDWRLGLLYLATSKAGLKVLGVLFIAGLGLGAYVWWLNYRDDQEIAALYARCSEILAADGAKGYTRLTPEVAACLSAEEKARR